MLAMLLAETGGRLFSQEVQDNPGNRNPLVPGYFADPTIRKFGDTYYLYATTDGVKLASGEPQVWISRDFVNWYNMEMEVPLPDGLTNCWAPDVIQGKNGKYYYFMGNCQENCNIYGYVSASPTGPWERLNGGNPVIPAGTGIKNLPALDAQFLWDGDTLMAYFGTWCTSFRGMGWAAIDPNDMSTILRAGSIPIAQIPKAFEGAFPLKRNNTYLLMYSSGDCRLNTYAVRYAWAHTATGPFHEGRNNPLLTTSADGTIDSPGHHSVLQVGDASFIVYHRHNNPHSTGGEFRQVCADRLVFENDSTIVPVKAGHSGSDLPGANQVRLKNLALAARVQASSAYHLRADSTAFAPATDYTYRAAFATDDNNGTLWKAGSTSLPQSLTIDLGAPVPVKRTLIEFEYPTYYYEYRTEYSVDSISWTVFSDRTANRSSGCPMIDDGQCTARYIRITVTGTEKTGMYAAIWNVKVYDTLFELPSLKHPVSPEGPGAAHHNRLLVDLDATNLKPGILTEPVSNQGTLGGRFLLQGQPSVCEKDGIRSLYFDGSSYLTLNRKAPVSLDWNAPFTASAWVCNPEIGYGECLLVWNSRENMLQSSYAALMYGSGPFGCMAFGDGYVDLPYKTLPSAGRWHHLAVAFDGMTACVYVDGMLQVRYPVNLFVAAGAIHIGTSGEEAERFSGYLSSVQLYEGALDQTAIEKLMQTTDPIVKTHNLTFQQ
jgi:xylan 1,4-beta-xylosidase